MHSYSIFTILPHTQWLCVRALAQKSSRRTEDLFHKEASMKKLLIMCLALGLVAGSASAQMKLAGFVGYGMSAFDTDEFQVEDQAGYIPLGIQGLYEVSPGISVGAEINLAVVPFTWEIEFEGFGKVGETKVKQTIIGALAKYEIGQGNMRPHIRGGIGMYTGGSEFVAEDGSGLGDSDTDYKSAIGFNFGGGITADWGMDKFWLAEFVYHIVSREPDFEDAESFGANNWAIQLGAGMNF